MFRVTCVSSLESKLDPEKLELILRKRLLEILFEHLDPVIADLFGDISLLPAVSWIFLTCNAKHPDYRWCKAVVYELRFLGKEDKEGRSM